DFGRMLHTLAERYGAERSLRGLVILSDGADNGTRFPALGEAAKWRALGGPVQPFALGQPNTSAAQRDIAITSITPEPSPLPGEATVVNNEISTFLTVTKEGVSVLYVDRLREETKFIRYALAGDPRFRLTEAIRQTDAPPAAADADFLQLDRQAYDVIILG